MENRYIRYVLNKDINVAELVFLLKKTDVVALDTETTWDKPIHANLLTIQLAFEAEGKFYSVFIDARERVSKMVLNQLEKKKWICHNAKFDYTIMKKNTGLVHDDVECTMIMSQLLTLGAAKEEKKHSLANLVREYLDPYAYTLQGNLFAPISTKEIRETFNTVEFTNSQIIYALRDAEFTYALFYKLYKRLEEEELLDVYYKVEKKFILVLADMEINGIRLNVDEWNTLWHKNELVKLEYKNRLKEIADINWDSWMQVNKVMKTLGVNTSYIDKKTGLLKEGVNATVLSGVDNDVVKLYLSYKEMAKLTSSYGEKFLTNVDEDGCIHSSFLQMVDTGRVASSSPNIQQIPRDKSFRDCFEAEKGRTFVIADYSAQEVLLAGDLYNEEGILTPIREGKDVHLNTASLTYGEHITDKEDIRRQIAKTVIFLTIYGGGPKKLADQYDMPMNQATFAVRKIKEVYPNLMNGLEDKFLQTLKNGFILTNSFSKRRIQIKDYEKFKILSDFVNRFSSYNWDIRPDIMDEYSKMKSQIKRKSFNYPIQSSGADMSKRAGIILREKLRKIGHPLFSFVLMAHDEWVLECKIEDAEEVSRILSESMVEASKEILANSEGKAKAIPSIKWNK